jgi:uncharacterized protein (TIGR00255 family)
VRIFLWRPRTYFGKFRNWELIGKKQGILESMIRSMTAFARSAGEHAGAELVWELRSVNHRYLDPTVRLPEELRALEPLVRERLAGRLGRGKVETLLRYRPAGEEAEAIQVSQARLNAVLHACREVEKRSAEASSPAVMDLLRWPGVIQEQELDIKTLQGFALELLDSALDELIATREREGEQIARLLGRRNEAIRSEVQRVRERLPDVRARIRERLETRLADLQVAVDTSRLEQELVYMTQKMDVEEELDRLEAHVVEIGAVLERDEPVGRRLDFLMQELNREANTLASKSEDTQTTASAVELKVLIEQMREQVQNVE